jgi:hypothetical protein
MSRPRLSNQYRFRFISPDLTWAFDSTQPTNRYLEEPYFAKKIIRELLDFFCYPEC